MAKMGRPRTAHLDPTAAELEAMSHQEFKRRFMTKSMGVTRNSAYLQVPQTTVTPDEGEHHKVTVKGGGLPYPSELRLIRTWRVTGWD